MRSDLPARGSPTTTTWARGRSTNDSKPLNRVISTLAIRIMFSVDRLTSAANGTPCSAPRDRTVAHYSPTRV